MNTSNRQFSEKFIGTVLFSLAGPFIWVLHFAVVYAVQHAACVMLGNRAGFWVATSIIVITIVALLSLVLLIAKPDILHFLHYDWIEQEATREFFPGTMRLLAFLSFFGVLWSGIALFFLPACGSVA